LSAGPEESSLEKEPGQQAVAAGRAAVRSRRLGSLLVILLVLVILFLGRGLWLPLMGRFLVVSDPPRKADAVVPLGGGGVRRVAQAAALLKDGYATWFVATNAELDLPGVRSSYSQLVWQEAQWQGVTPERILVAPGLVETTYEEALAVRTLAEEQGWRSLLVVTDPYHTRRARLCFQQVFRGTDVTIAVHAVEGSWYDAETWWQSADGLRETWTEYVKLALHVLGYS
jgi:uncharacterized SAM-binding protein YcdF (DUF218 family)